MSSQENYNFKKIKTDNRNRFAQVFNTIDTNRLTIVYIAEYILLKSITYKNIDFFCFNFYNILLFIKIFYKYNIII